MKDIEARQKILDTISASPEPMTARELIGSLGFSETTTWNLIHRLRNEGFLRSRKRPSPHCRRAPLEYYAGPARAELPTSEDFEDEVPDHVWWREQAARGFKRPRQTTAASDTKPV